jgi:hypothetical protein
MDLGEVGWNDVDWIGLAQDRDKRGSLLKAEMKLWAAEKAGKFLSGCRSGGIWTSVQLHS